MRSGARREEMKKKLLQKQAHVKDQLVKKYEDERMQLDRTQDERRKQLAHALEDELNSFSAKQEEERDSLRAGIKAEEEAWAATRTARAEEKKRVETVLRDRDMKNKELVKASGATAKVRMKRRCWVRMRPASELSAIPCAIFKASTLTLSAMRDARASTTSIGRFRSAGCANPKFASRTRR